MKLRFKASKEDWIIFLVVCIFLLYLVSIAVLNIHSLAGGQGFYGLLPFEAFTKEYIGLTILFYLLVLVGLFASVKSYFFDRSEGFGIDMQGKGSKGYSRWSKVSEMKKSLDAETITNRNFQKAGLPLINDGKTVWVDNGESHNLVIGATGSGKTQCIVHPLVKVLAKRGESMIITDPKGEIYRENAGLLKAKGYDIVVLNFREPQRGNAWNPLAIPYNLYREGNSDKAMELLDDLALNILYDENNNAEPFWEKTSADYFTGISLGLFDDAKLEEVNLNSISLMSTIGEERFAGNSNYMKEYFLSKDPAGAAYTSASGTVMAPSETKGGILSTFKQKIRLFASRENLSEMLSYSDFSMADIGRKKTAVFLIIQDEKKTYHALATIFVKQCYETLIDVAQENGGKLPVRTNFILDEFANMPPLKDVTTMITAARSRQIRFTLIIQNFAQLNQVYGKDNAETIRSNCGNLIYLITTELSALKEISELCGEKESKKDDKTASTPLVTVSDLQKMKLFEVIILRLRMNPFKTKLTPNFQINWGEAKYPEQDYPHREKKPIKVFDLRSFVKELKNKQMQEKFGNLSGGDNPNPFNPFGGDISNPFGGSSNPFGGNSQNNSSFNVDELLNNINKKIAELEKEEEEEARKKQEENNKQEQVTKEVVEEKEEVKPQEQTEITKETKIPEDKPFTEGIAFDLTNQTPPKSFTDINFDKNDKFNITDDQFFDDFFDE